MSRNAIRRPNTIQFASLYKWVALAFIFTVFGIVYVFLQIRNINLASDIKKLETATAEVNRRNAILQVDLDRRMKPRALQAKIESFRLPLVNVSELRVLEARLPATYTGEYRGALVKRENAP